MLTGVTVVTNTERKIVKLKAMPKIWIILPIFSKTLKTLCLMSRFLSVMSPKHIMFPKKIPESPDSRANLQIPEDLCCSPETGLLGVVTLR